MAAPGHRLEGPLGVAAGETTLEFAEPPSRSELERQLESGNRYVRQHARLLLDELDTNGAIRRTYPYPISVVQFGGQLTLVALAGETVVDYSLMCKRRYEGPAVWVAGYTDDVFAYLPSLRVLREGGYEGRTGIVHQLVPTPFAESVESRVMAVVDRLVDEVTSPTP